MENKPRKSKALIITIIVIIFLVVVSYLLIKNRDMFGVKTSNSIAKIFAPLITSENEKNISKIDENSIRTVAQAGEDLKMGDNVTRFGTNADNNPIVIKSKPGDEIFGFAGSDMGSGELGEIITNNSGLNTFWESFFNLLNNVFNTGGGNGGNGGGGNGGGNGGGGNGAGDFAGQCSDTLDNDDDGLADALDPQCHTDGDNTNPDSYDPEHYSETTLPGGGGGNGGGGGIGDFAGQCSDTLDNDDDGLADTLDPQCHVDGDLTKAYVPDHYSEATFPGGGGGEYTRQCSDTLDNDNDNLIDESDPQCHVDGDLTKAYIPDHYSEATFPGGGGGGDYIKQCSDTLDNDNDNLIDILDPGCHTDGDATNTNSYNPDDYSEVNGGGGNENGTPDLTASSVTPATASINIPVNLTTIITNNGDGSTKFNFTSFFNIIKDSDIDFEDGDDTTVSKLNLKNLFVKIFNKISFIKKAIALTGNINTSTGVELSVVVPTLTAQTSNVTTVSYTFYSTGVYKIRACADKKSSNDAGTVEESNEENNCSDWTTLTVSGSLPPPDDDITPPDDDVTPPEPPEETVTPENKCLLIQQNPLVFTDSEKAKLAELLRKFYLISSTLKTEEDIVTVYSEIDQYKNFIAQTDGLIDSCYKEVATAKAKGGDAVWWVQNGNPWYRTGISGSVPFGNANAYLDYNLLEGGVGTVTVDGEGDYWGGEGCKVVSGYYYGTLVKTIVNKPRKAPRPNQIGTAGGNCDDYNKRPFLCAAINSNLYGNNNGGPDQDLLDAGCKWKEGVYLDGVEKVLEMW